MPVRGTFRIVMTPESVAFQFKNHFEVMPKVAILGVRGYTVQGYMSAPNDIYDDAIISWIDGHIEIFRGSVDPGSYYLQHPLNPMGCARLKCGLWSYRIGEHLHKKALVQADEVIVHRIDKNGNKQSEDSGWFGINIHSGGAEYLVGRYSAGCQVIWTQEPWRNEWLKFFEPICSAMDLFKITKVPYLLIDTLQAIPA